MVKKKKGSCGCQKFTIKNTVTMFPVLQDAIIFYNFVFYSTM